jgi:hypothetical protein
MMYSVDVEILGVVTHCVEADSRADAEDIARDICEADGQIVQGAYAQVEIGGSDE